MSDSPYINLFTSDFLGGVAAANMTAEQIGVYTVILLLIADTGAPIDDDATWLARRCNISTRKMSMILDDLANMPRKITRKNGLIGNEKMLKEVVRRDKKGRQARDAANEKWRRYRSEAGEQLDLDYRVDNPEIKKKKSSKNKDRTPKSAYAETPPHENSENDEKTRIYPADKPEIIEPIISRYSEQNRDISNSEPSNPHMQTRAGVNPDPESITEQPNQESLEQSAREKSELDRSSDFLGLLERVSSAAGYVSTTTSQFAEASGIVRAWMQAGIDFDEIVIPVIEAALRKDPDRTSSLKRFDRSVRHGHAVALAEKKRVNTPLKALETPQTAPEGEIEAIHALRLDLLAALGPRAYVQLLNRVSLSIAPVLNGKRILKIAKPPRFPFLILDGDRTDPIHKIARKHGFDEVWE